MKKMSNQKKTLKKEVIIAAIAGLTLIEIVALFNGINGTLMTLVVGAIAGLAGWTAPQLKVY